VPIEGDGVGLVVPGVDPGQPGLQHGQPGIEQGDARDRDRRDRVALRLRRSGVTEPADVRGRLFSRGPLGFRRNRTVRARKSLLRAQPEVVLLKREHLEESSEGS
jgi:hypothetical protein